MAYSLVIPEPKICDGLLVFGFICDGSDKAKGAGRVAQSLKTLNRESPADRSNGASKSFNFVRRIKNQTGMAIFMRDYCIAKIHAPITRGFDLAQSMPVALQKYNKTLN
jgi:hypothetical protein